jgi:arsenite oxidase small subunit
MRADARLHQGCRRAHQLGEHMSVSRSRFLRLTSTSAVAVTAVAATAVVDEPSASAATSHKSIGKASSFVVGKPVDFMFPDDGSPAIAVRMSHPVEGGVGPNRDIVAYSRICVHKGCPVRYDSTREIFVCPCHYTTYDATKEGAVVIGQATTSLPRILLHYDPGTGDVTPTGVDGLLYGRFNDSKLS